MQLTNAHMLTGQTQSVSLHTICSLSIIKHSYVGGLLGKYGMCISWLLTLCHNPGITQIHINLTSFTPPGCEQLHRANSEQAGPQAVCMLLLCTSSRSMNQTKAFLNLSISSENFTVGSLFPNPALCEINMSKSDGSKHCVNIGAQELQ